MCHVDMKGPFDIIKTLKTVSYRSTRGTLTSTYSLLWEMELYCRRVAGLASKPRPETGCLTQGREELYKRAECQELNVIIGVFLMSKSFFRFHCVYTWLICSTDFNLWYIDSSKTVIKAYEVIYRECIYTLHRKKITTVVYKMLCEFLCKNSPCDIWCHHWDKMLESDKKDSDVTNAID